MPKFNKFDGGQDEQSGDDQQVSGKDQQNEAAGSFEPAASKPS
jgi:hypothetical protein